MGRRTPGRRVPPRGPGGRRVPPPPPGRPSPRGSAPSPRTTPSLGAIGPAVMAAAGRGPGRPEPRGSAPSPSPSRPPVRYIRGPFGTRTVVGTAAAADKLRGPVTRVPASAFKGKVFDSRTGLDKGPVKEPVRSKDPETGSFERMLNTLEQQRKEAIAKTGSSALSPKQIAETMAKDGPPFDGAVFRATAENLQKMKEEKARQALLKDMEERAKREQADSASGMAMPGFSATDFLKLKDKINPDFKDLTEGGTKSPSDIFRSKLEDIKGKKEEERAGTYSDAFRADLTKKINDEIKREEQIKAEKTGITKEGRSDFNYDAFKAKLEEIQRRKEEGKPVFKGIRGGARPVARTGGKPRTVRRTGGRPAPFFSPRPTRPPVRYGIGGPFGTRTFFGSRPSRPAPFFSPRPTRPTVRYGPFNLFRRPY